MRTLRSSLLNELCDDGRKRSPRALTCFIIRFLRRPQLPKEQSVFLKLSIPTEDDLYLEFVSHPAVIRVLALSGGYSRHEGNERLARNQRIIASFSRGLLEGLTAQQSDAEFNAELDAAVESIYRASTAKSESR